MRVSRRSLSSVTFGLATAVLTVAFAAAVPSSASAQNAGDEQYADPFGEVPDEQPAGGQDGGGGGGGGQGDTGGGGDAPASAPSPGETADPPASTVPAQSDVAVAGEELPRTGPRAELIAAAGLALLGFGALLQVALVRARRMMPAVGPRPVLGLHTAPRLPPPGLRRARR